MFITMTLRFVVILLVMVMPVYWPVMDTDVLTN